MELQKVNNLEKSLIVQSGKLQKDMITQYPEVVTEFAPLYEYAKSFEAQAKELEERFTSASKDERLAMEKEAKKLISAVKKSRTKGNDTYTGAEGIKANLKELSKGYVKTIDTCFNIVASYSKEMEESLQKIVSYKDKLEAERLAKLREEREVEVKSIGALEFIGLDEDLASYYPEAWDARLQQFHMFVDAKKIKAEAEAKAMEEAKQKEELAKKLRSMRGKMLADLSYFYANDLAELSEVDFLNLMETAKQELEKKKAFEAQKEAEALERAKQAQAIEEKQKSLQGTDAQKFKILLDTLRDLEELVSTQTMQSDKGQKAHNWLKQNLSALSTKGYEAYNRLR